MQFRGAVFFGRRLISTEGQVVMRIAALVLGVIGGLYGLTVGWWIYALVSFGGGKDGVLALLVPLTGLIGGSLSLVAPSLAGGLMLLSASLTALVIGFNVFVAIPLLLLGVGGVLALLGANETAGAGTNHGGPMHNRSGIDDLDRRVRSGLCKAGAGSEWSVDISADYTPIPVEARPYRLALSSDDGTCEFWLTPVARCN